MNKFKEFIPVFQHVSKIYKELVSERYKKQLECINKIHRDYVIEDTVFTTVTVNKNFRTALHKDKGDLEDGFGNMVVVSSGKYDNGYTLFPQYGIGVDCRDGDFISMNVHEWHCNAPIIGDGNRISFIFYLREKMINLCPKLI